MKEYKGRDCLGPLGENLKQGAKRPQKTGIFRTGGTEPELTQPGDLDMRHYYDAVEPTTAPA